MHLVIGVQVQCKQFKRSYRTRTAEIDAPRCWRSGATGTIQEMFSSVVEAAPLEDEEGAEQHMAFNDDDDDDDANRQARTRSHVALQG